MAVTTLPKRETRYTEAEWQARVDLAAAHRLSVMHGFQEGIFNHLTLTVPGKEDRYLQIPFGLHWSEVTASSFMEIGFDGVPATRAKARWSSRATASMPRSTG